jgi:hypothetical protein
MARSTERSHLPAVGALTIHGAQKASSAHEDLRRMPAAVRVAKEMGTGLGECEILLGSLPRSRREPAARIAVSLKSPSAASQPA